MSEQMKQEIMKAHIYGLSEKAISEANGITVSEVREALADKEAIEDKRNFMLESGWMQA